MFLIIDFAVFGHLIKGSSSRIRFYSKVAYMVLDCVLISTSMSIVRDEEVSFERGLWSTSERYFDR